MWGQKWVWPRSDCISVTSMAQNVPIVVWPETPTVPGMVSPAPATTLLESTQRGNSTHTPRQDPSFHSPDVCVCVCDISCSHPRFCSIIASCPECHNALRLVYQVIITGSERHDSQVLCNAYQYALDHLNSSFYLLPSLPPSLLFFSRFPFTRLSHFHHMFKITLSLLPSLPSQQTIQAAGCSPWQRRPAVQWVAN